MSGYLFGLQNTESESRLRFLSVMITRLLLSLKKAAASRKEHGWSFGEPTTHTTMRFAGRRGDATRDEIHLDTFLSTHEGTESQ